MTSKKTSISDLFDRYGDPVDIQKVSNLDDLNRIELFSQEKLKEDPEFNIFSNIIFSRSPLAHWPDCSVVGDYYYRKGDLETAYKLFHSIRKSGLAPHSIPMWSQGIYGMQLKTSERTCIADFGLENVYKGIKSERGTEACVGFDLKYLPFFSIYRRSALSKQINVNAVVCYDDYTDVEDIIEKEELEGVDLYALKTAKDLSFRNRKGFYTLSRYLLAHHILEDGNIREGIFVTDVDAVLTDYNQLNPYLGGSYDIGVIELKKPRRPWLKHTAPFLFIANTRVGVQFAQEIGERARALMSEAEIASNISLWGGDQAIITSTLDYLHYGGEEPKVFNFVKSVEKFMQQAQSLSKDKNSFLRMHGGSK